MLLLRRPGPQFRADVDVGAPAEKGYLRREVVEAGRPPRVALANLEEGPE